ncbi:MAG TPA: cyclic nucleotide-binding domain-containing protein [Pilimelia sp.]|nr:cyclic nucleotide-binding domain-containing protein [Pilimelia sp.]
MNIIYDALAEQPFFEGFSERELQRLSQCARRSMFHGGAQIFEEGGRADRFWVIQRGAVRLYAHVPAKGDVPVETLGAHAVLGWSWLFHPYRWNFTATAVENTHTVEFNAARVREMCDSEPEFGYELTRRFMKVIANRLRHTRRRLVDLYEVAT